jgi:hypothetical protein
MKPQVLDNLLDKPRTLKGGVYQKGRLYWIYKAKKAKRLVEQVLGVLIS